MTVSRKDCDRWLLPTVYEIDENGEQELNKDKEPIEIVDPVAVDIAVEGKRKVGLTLTERRLVVGRMIRGAWSVNEIASHCGTKPECLEPLFSELGYEVTRADTKKKTMSLRRIKEKV